MTVDPDHIVIDTRLKVRRLVTNDTADRVRRRYEAEFGEPPEQPGGWYRPDDWRRTSFVLDQLRPAARVLDVGAGAGQFANMLAASGKFGAVAALDHTRFGKYREYSPIITRHDASIVELPFDDDEFDVVTCMEVLEHVPDDVLIPGLAELRRVCRGQLVMSIPFEEQEPLSKGHHRRFEGADVAGLFPDGRYALLDRPRMPWMIIVEHHDGTPVGDFVVGSSPPVSVADHDDLTPEQRRIVHLEQELAKLKSRKAVRASNWVGHRLRRIRSLVVRRRRTV